MENLAKGEAQPPLPPIDPAETLSGMIVLSSEDTETGVTRTSMKIRSSNDPPPNRTNLPVKPKAGAQIAVGWWSFEMPARYLHVLLVMLFYGFSFVSSSISVGSFAGSSVSCASLHRTKGKALTYWSYPFSRFHQLRIRTAAFAGARCANSPTTHQQDEVLVDTFYQSDVAACFSQKCPISMRFDKNQTYWHWRKRCSTFNF